MRRQPLGEGESQREEEGEGSLDTRVPHARVDIENRIRKEIKRVPTIKVSPDIFKVPVSLFAENRQRLVAKLKSLQEVPENAVVLLQGGGDQVKKSLEIGTI